MIASRRWPRTPASRCVALTPEDQPNKEATGCAKGSRAGGLLLSLGGRDAVRIVPGRKSHYHGFLATPT